MIVNNVVCLSTKLLIPGSSTAGGISDVLYYNNTMFADAKGQFGQGVHIKLRDRFGGYVKNVAWIDNVLHSVNQALAFEFGYQGNPNWKPCTKDTCPEVRDIVIRNLTVHMGNPGYLHCYGQRPCQNITIEDINFLNFTKPKAINKVDCGYVNGRLGGRINPPELFDLCPNLTNAARLNEQLH
jgi:polygalacturonase